jgi:ribose 1,5-bisphosphokinase PhnN
MTEIAAIIGSNERLLLLTMDTAERFSAERAMDRQLSASARDYALLEEFSFVRREAQAEANLAYAHWHAHSNKEAYAVYRAAQDRADAAQDDLADWARALAS